MKSSEFIPRYAAPYDSVQPFERLLILGCGGSGKSTLAIELGHITGLPVIHLDRLFWLPGWKHRNRTDFDALLADELNNPRWIIDGDYSRTLAMRLERCDAVVVLDYPRAVCAAGVIRRRVQYAGRSRESMAQGCPERLDPEFVRWVWNFRRSRLPAMLDLLAITAQREQPPQIFILNSRMQTRRWLKAVRTICGMQN